MNKEQLKKEFRKKFCSFYDMPVIISGVLQGDGYNAITTNNGNDVENWWLEKLDEAVKEERQRCIKLLDNDHTLPN